MTLMALIMFTVPRSNDEYHFIGEQLEICRSNGLSTDKVFTLPVIWELIKIEYFGDNARLANIFGLTLLGFPQWIWGIMRVAMMWLLTHMMLKIAGVKRGQTQKMVWTVALIVFGISWEIFYLTGMFLFNYTLTGALLLWAVRLLLERKFLSWWCLPFGFIMGACHESFGLAFFGGSIVAALFHRDLLTRGYLIMLTGCITGIAWLMLAPGWGAYHHVPELRPRMLLYVFQIWIVPVYLFCWTTLLLGKRSRSVALAPLPMFTLGTMPLLIVGCLGYKTRAAFPCNILAICSGVWMFSRLASPTLLKKAWEKCLCSIAAVIVIFHLIAVARATFMVRAASDSVERECQKRVEKVRAHGSREICFFFDVPQAWDLPWYVLRRPLHEHFRFIRGSGRTRAHFYEMDWVFTLPTVLREFTPDKATPVSSSPGLWLYEGHIVGPAEYGGTSYDATVTYAHACDYVDATAIEFTTANGRHYSYIYTERNLPGCFSGNPVDVVLHNPKPRM